MATSPVSNQPSAVKALRPWPVQVAVGHPRPAHVQVAHGRSVEGDLVRPVSSRMLTSTPGQRQPGLGPRRRGDVVLGGQSRICSWGQAIEASGDVSVIPHAWTIRMSKSWRSARSANAGGWLPPQTMWRSVGQPLAGEPARRRRPSHTVGTPAATVTRSPTSRSTKARGVEGHRRRRPASRRRRPPRRACPTRWRGTSAPAAGHSRPARSTSRPST